MVGYTKDVKDSLSKALIYQLTHSFFLSSDILTETFKYRKIFITIILKALVKKYDAVQVANINKKTNEYLIRALIVLVNTNTINTKNNYKRCLNKGTMFDNLILNKQNIIRPVRILEHLMATTVNARQY